MNTQAPAPAKKELTGDAATFKNLCDGRTGQLTHEIATDKASLEQIKEKIKKQERIAAYTKVVENLKLQLAPLEKKQTLNVQELKSIDSLYENYIESFVKESKKQ